MLHFTTLRLTKNETQRGMKSQLLWHHIYKPTASELSITHALRQTFPDTTLHTQRERNTQRTINEILSALNKTNLQILVNIWERTSPSPLSQRFPNGGRGPPGGLSKLPRGPQGDYFHSYISINTIHIHVIICIISLKCIFKECKFVSPPQHLLFTLKNIPFL